MSHKIRRRSIVGRRTKTNLRREDAFGIERIRIVSYFALRKQPGVVKVYQAAHLYSHKTDGALDNLLKPTW